MTIKVTEANKKLCTFTETEAGQNLAGFIHPSGALMIVGEIKGDSNLVINYSCEYAYAPGGWIEASGDLIGGSPDEVLGKLLDS